MTTWLQMLGELIRENRVAQFAAMNGGLAECELASKTAAAVTDLLRRYAAAGSPGLDTRYPEADRRSGEEARRYAEESH